MSLFNVLVKKGFLSAYDMLMRTSVGDSLQFLNDSQWWSKNELVEYQNRNFLELFQYASANVPFYQNLYKSKGIRSSDIQSLDDITRLPVVTKEMLRSAGKDQIIGIPYQNRNILRFRSSGSTGSPFEYFMCHKSYSLKYAAGIRGWGWMGYQLGDKYAKLSQNERQTKLKKLQDVLNRNVYIFIPDLKEDNIKAVLAKLNQTKPPFIRCYPDPLVFIADYIAKKGSLNFKPKAINSTGNILTPEARNKIETAFQCPVYDSYSVEGSALFYQVQGETCYLGAAEQAVTEIMNGNTEVSPGEEGQHITTDLHNYAMPFIRYNTGDRLVKGIQKEYSGRNLISVEKIVGRDSDVLITPEGNRLIVHLFTIYFEYIESIISFQVEQTKSDTFIFRFVVTKDFSKETESKIRSYWQPKIGKNSKLHIESVDKIPAMPSGKRRFLIRNKNITLS